MTILQARNIQASMARNMWLDLASSRSGETGKFSISIHGGTQPTAAAVATNWNSTYYNTHLVHYHQITIQRTITGTFLNTIQLGQGAPSATAANTGTATWAIIWPGSIVNPPGSTIPSTVYAVVPVTNTTGDGVIRMLTTSITSGNSYTLDVFYVQMTGGVA